MWLLPNQPDPVADQTNEAAKAKFAKQKAEYDHAESILLWYLDSYLPMAAGFDFWGPTIRPFHLMTDKKEVPGDPSGKERVLVTVTSEAFGVLLYANCRDKWLADFDLRKTSGNKKIKIPKYDKDDPATHKHQNKWSNSRTGSVQGGGWAIEAISYFNKCISGIKTFREYEEKENQNALYELGRLLIKQANDIKIEETASETSSGDKRKRGAGSPVDEIEVVELDYLSE